MFNLFSEILDKDALKKKNIPVTQIHFMNKTLRKASKGIYSFSVSKLLGDPSGNIRIHNGFWTKLAESGLKQKKWTSPLNSSYSNKSNYQILA